MKLFAVSDSLRIFAVTKCPFGQLSLYLIGNPKAENTVCKDSQRGRRLRTLSFCVVKSRKFETLHRGNATLSVRVSVLYLKI